MTVFGFQPEHAAEVMREFARCGEVLSFGSGREDKVNWVHIQYAVRWPGHSQTSSGSLCSIVYSPRRAGVGRVRRLSRCIEQPVLMQLLDTEELLEELCCVKATDQGEGATRGEGSTADSYLAAAALHLRLVVL